MPKYMRIQGREIAFKTGKSAGLFALCWRRIRDGIFSAEDEAAFRAEDEWFRANLPVPPFKELGADKIRIRIIEESWIIKNFYEYHGFVHTGTEKYDHLPFTVGRMEWTTD